MDDEIKPSFDTHNPQSAQSPKLNPNFVSNVSKFQFWWILLCYVVFAHADGTSGQKRQPPSTRMATSILQKHPPICPNNIQQTDLQQHWVQTFANGRWKPGTQKPSHCYPTRPVDVKLWSCWTVQQRAKHKLRDRSQVIPNEKCSEKHNILMNPVISPKYTEVLQIPHLL